MIGRQQGATFRTGAAKEYPDRLSGACRSAIVGFLSSFGLIISKYDKIIYLREVGELKSVKENRSFPLLKRYDEDEDDEDNEEEDDEEDEEDKEEEDEENEEEEEDEEQKEEEDREEEDENEKEEDEESKVEEDEEDKEEEDKEDEDEENKEEEKDDEQKEEKIERKKTTISYRDKSHPPSKTSFCSGW